MTERIIVTPDPHDDEGTPQEPVKRFPWSKPAVRVKPSAKDKREFRRAHGRRDR